VPASHLLGRKDPALASISLGLWRAGCRRRSCGVSGQLRGGLRRGECAMGLLAPEQTAAIAPRPRKWPVGGALGWRNSPCASGRPAPAPRQNMNVNEVISTRAIEAMGGVLSGQQDPVHPTTTSTSAKSSNRQPFPPPFIWRGPSEIDQGLIPRFGRPVEALRQRRKGPLPEVIKVGPPSHLQDAGSPQLGPRNSPATGPSWSKAWRPVKRCACPSAAGAGDRTARRWAGLRPPPAS